MTQMPVSNMPNKQQQQEVLSLWQNNNDDEKTDFNQQRMRSGWDKGHSVSAHADAKKLNALPKPNTAGVSKRSRNHQHEVRRFDQQLTAAIHEEELIMDEICDEMKIDQDVAVMQDMNKLYVAAIRSFFLLCFYLCERIGFDVFLC